MEYNKFISVSRNQFIEELSKLTFLDNYQTSVGQAYDETDENEFQIYIGDIENDKTLTFDALNLLVIGNIKAKWLNTTNNDELGYDEGGSLFVTGSVDCEYFSSHYGKLIVIGKSINVNKILNNAFQDSALIVQNDLTTEYFNGIDIWAEVGGKVNMKYGEGYCLPIGYTDAVKQWIKPIYNEQQSLDFLGINENDEDFGAYTEYLVNKIIKKRNE